VYRFRRGGRLLFSLEGNGARGNGETGRRRTGYAKAINARRSPYLVNTRGRTFRSVVLRNIREIKGVTRYQRTYARFLHSYSGGAPRDRGLSLSPTLVSRYCFSGILLLSLRTIPGPTVFALSESYEVRNVRAGSKILGCAYKFAARMR
jgi:hypothetical protein